MIKKIFSFLPVFVCFFVLASGLVACGDSVKTTKNLEFEISGSKNKTCTVVGYKTFYGDERDNNIVIPSKYKGIPVTSIGDSAFSGCSNLTSIVISKGVKSIGDYSFYDCGSLINIEIPSSVTSIGSGAFEDCSKLKYNEYDNGCYLGNKDNPYVVFIEAKTKDIKQCLIKDKCKIVYSYAFFGCSSLTSVTIPSSVTSIGDAAFSGCDKLFYNEYDNGYYLGNKDNPYIAFIKVKTKDIERCIINNDCRVIVNGAFSGCRSLTSIAIPSSVTSIGEYAFDGCRSLTSITIPEGVTSIGSGAFAFSSLTSIEIPSSVTRIGDDAFRGCSSLTSIAIPEGVTSIGEYAFSGCSSLTSITIPDSVTSIESGSFAGSSLTSITVSENNSNYKSIDGNLYSKDGTILLQYSIGKQDINFTIPSCVTSIGRSAFSSCESITSIEIPSSVTSIGEYAFAGCRSLTSITIPEGVTSIGSGAFSNCSSLTSITIPEGVTSIGRGAFDGCSSLTSIEIPEGVKSIGEYAFSGCSSLTSITIPDSVTSIGAGAFISCSSLTSITIPDSVTSIGTGAFRGCSSLTSIEIPEGVTSIGLEAFKDCSSLTSIAVPFVGATLEGMENVHFGYIFGASSYYYNDNYVPTSLKEVIIIGVTSIGRGAFRGCSSLTSIAIPEGVTSIGELAFSGCSSLTTVYYTGNSNQWSTISIGSDNSPLTSATIYYYSETEPTEEGNYWHYDDNGKIVIWP